MKRPGRHSKSCINKGPYDLLEMDAMLFDLTDRDDVMPEDIPENVFGNVNLCILGAGWYAIEDYPRAFRFVERIRTILKAVRMDNKAYAKSIVNNAYCHMVRNLASRGELQKALECRARMTAPYAREDESIKWCRRKLRSAK